MTRRQALKSAAAFGAGVGFIGPWRWARAQASKPILIGLGSFWGAVLGGLMVGMASGLSNLIVPRGSILIMSVLMTLVLLWRPRGLAGQKSILEL